MIYYKSIVLIFKLILERLVSLGNLTSEEKNIFIQKCDRVIELYKEIDKPIVDHYSAHLQESIRLGDEAEEKFNIVQELLDESYEKYLNIFPEFKRINERKESILIELNNLKAKLSDIEKRETSTLTGKIKRNLMGAKSNEEKDIENRINIIRNEMSKLTLENAADQIVRRLDAENSEYVNKISLERMEKEEELFKEREKEREKIEKLKEDMQQEYDFLPMGYRNDSCAKSFKKYLESGRADSLKECIEIIELESHQARMLEGSSKSDKNIENLIKETIEENRRHSEQNQTLHQGLRDLVDDAQEAASRQEQTNQILEKIKREQEESNYYLRNR